MAKNARVVLALVGLLSFPALAQNTQEANQVSARIVEGSEAIPGAQAAVPNLPSDQNAQEPTSNLDVLVNEALQNNPGVRSALHVLAAKRLQIPQAKSWPDPKVGVGWMGNITPFSVQHGDPSSYRGVEVMEEVPFPGKLGLRGDIASKEADAAWWDYEFIRRRVAADVKAAYFDYFFYDKAIEITQKNRDLLTKLSEIAEARYRVGKGIQQDVLRAQTELSLILQRLTVLEQQRSTAKARLNTLLSRPPETPLPAATEIPPPALAYSLDELYRLAHENDPGLNREQQIIERNQYAASLAQKDYYPDLCVGYMYQQRPMMPDMHGFTFSVNIPVFYKSKQREAVAQAEEKHLSSQAAREDRTNQVNFEVKQQYLLAQAAQQLYELYARGVVPQASLALESSMSSYQVGTADFLTVLANFSNVLDYQVEYYHELVTYETALARLEPLIGLDLTTAQPPRPILPDSPKK